MKNSADVLAANFFLTNGGNVLVALPTKKYFLKPNGEFIRQVSEDEAGYLVENCTRFIPAVKNDHPFFADVEMPVWHFLWSVEDTDQSNHIDILSNNGGAYGRYTTAEYYAAKMPNGDWKFRVLTRVSNRNDFSQDDFGSYANNLSYAWIKNTCNGEIGFCVQGREDYNEVMERLSFPTTLEAALRDAGRYTSPVSDGYGEYDDRSYEDRTTVYTVTFAQLKERALKLKKIGVVRPEKTKRRDRNTRQTASR